MDNNQENRTGNVDVISNGEWFTEEFVYDSVVKYLMENGFKIHKDEHKEPEKKERIIVASRYFTKEIIQVKGLHHESNRTRILKEAATNAYSSGSLLTSFADTLFNSLINFGKYYSDENSDIAMALPDNERYMSILERLKDYFKVNDLSLKIYLVNESGNVEASNLNN